MVKKNNPLITILTHLFLIAMSVLILIPLVWLITTSFKSKMELFADPYKLLPDSLSLDNFFKAWQYAPFGKYYLNTIITTFVLLLVQFGTVTLAAYAFGRLDFPGKNILFILFLMQMMITPQSTIYPNYLLVSKLHLLDTKMGMMCPYVASAMGVFLVRQAFMSIPSALEDAGKLDGCNTLQLIWNVFIPQIRTSLLAFSVISVTYHWNEFLWPLLVTETERSRPLTVGLTVFAQQAEGGAEWGLLMAATLIVSLPLLIAFTLFQKMFVQAFISSGLKG